MKYFSLETTGGGNTLRTHVINVWTKPGRFIGFLHMKKELLYPLIVFTGTTLIATFLPRYVTFDTSEQASISVQKSAVFLDDDALAQFVDTIPALADLIDPKKIGYEDEIYKKIWSSLGDFVASKFIRGGFYIYEYKIINSGTKIVELEVEAPDVIPLYLQENRTTTTFGLSSGRGKLKVYPASLPTPMTEVKLFGIAQNMYSATYNPEVRFSVGSAPIRIEELEDPRFRHDISVFGIDPVKNPGLTFITYMTTIGIFALFFMSGIWALFKWDDPKFMVRLRSDSDYAKMIRWLRQLKIHQPKRFRQVIREYRRTDE
ncbi:hypothetical protein U8P73_14695 [Rhizobium beringeri]|uniref:Uncharacterized protein n=1 Tax=Rhizobium leguminosarum bv. trifolii TaxID=386 RepID=A0A1C9I042_RHILT|nr:MULTISPECIES: hypothetical protein [Rhizobium]AOO92210.1 hypothetical protein [Rhizobium leguminosarum bv. trifolii]TBE54498.1 hypothetical protein ELH04_08790 [Rhizobium leguminosarum]WSG87303.1 hypothetical protein U8P73_14695 [Rhizobium beringeri]WSH59854.1 hypothetical protein U8P68_11055 [Rhizobium ruizarguesonis]